MNILLISDQMHPSQHSSVEGIFRTAADHLGQVVRVYFDRQLSQALRQDDLVRLPLRCRRHGLLAALSSVLDFADFDVLIVRNWFSVLRQCLRLRPRHAHLRLGMWESFPHTYRRLHEARVLGRALWRKTVEVKLKTLWENRLLEQVDFHLFISASFQQLMRPGVSKPWLALPMGVDPSDLPELKPRRCEGPLRLVYIGTIDPLRHIDTVIDRLHRRSEDFRLDIYSASHNTSVEALQHLQDPRIRLLPAIPRRELFRRLLDYDVGIAFIPDDELYRVASPTKTFEYAALGLAILLNPLPEHTRILNEDSALYGHFDHDGIDACLDRLFSTPRLQLHEMGQKARISVLQKRSYPVLADELAAFLQSLLKA